MQSGNGAVSQWNRCMAAKKQCEDLDVLQFEVFKKVTVEGVLTILLFAVMI